MAEFLSSLGPAELAFIALPSVLILYFVSSAIYNLFFSHLKSYPGPKFWAISAVPLEWSRITGKQVYTLLDLHQKYNSKVIRTAPNELSYVDPVAWRDVWAHRQGHQEFSKLFIAPSPNGIAGILSADRAAHSRFRRLLSHSFSEKGMREQQPIIQNYVDKLIENLRMNVGKGPQDMVSWFNFTTFDVIGRLAFGESFGCLERGVTHPWIEAIFNNLKALVFINTFKRFGFQRLLPLIAGTKAQKLRLYNMQFSSERIESRVKRGAEQGDFWDNVLKHSELERDPNIVPEKGMHIEEMKANASNLVLAGSETTATLLSGCTYQLLKNPEWMRKVTQEIRSAFKSSDDIDLFSVNKLEYTLAVLEETMRIYPPVPTQALRVVPAGGDTIDGKYVPGGTLIQMPQYVAYHLPANFAKPEEFHPERWLNPASHPEAKEFETDCKDVMQPFSVGPRNCIGRNLAYAEMRLILAKVLWNFDLKMTEQTGDWTGKQKTFILWEKGPLWVDVEDTRRVNANGAA